MRDTRIRSKLALLLVVPIAAIVSLAGLRLADSGRRAVDASTVRSLASLSADVSALSHELHRERMTAAQFLIDSKDGPTRYNQQTKRTDESTAAYTAHRQQLGTLPGGVDDRLKRVDQQLATVGTIRQRVLEQRDASVPEVVLRYGGIINDLISYREEVGQIAGDTNLADRIRAAAAFSKAKAEKSEEQAVAYASLGTGRLDQRQFASFLATLTAQQEALVAFSLTADARQRSIVGSTITGDAVQLASQMETEVGRSVDQVPRTTATEVSNAVGAVVDLMRWAEQRLDTALVADAGALNDAVVRQVVVESVVVGIILVLAVALALLLARSMVRSLTRLREGALAVAMRELPEAVARLRDARELGERTPAQIASQVHDPIQLSGRDEIGQVAKAFNVVHREAVRVAAEQAALRTSVSAMFLNLARRSQALVDRMIGELDDIERGEEDPKRLSRLFQLDHLATRMRRNDENLLVLAGADSSPPRREDALLVDVVRAAQSEVERYDRIEFGTVDQDVSVASHAVNDVVRLLAELFDNAVRFSPPEGMVVGEGRRVGDYVVIQVEDRGLGMTDELLATLNARVAEAAAVDLSAFRMMGLAVVGRLASRYGIRIELAHNPDGGTIAYVRLPTSILVLPRVRGREQLPGRPVSPLAVERVASVGSPGWPSQQWAAPVPTRHRAPAGGVPRAGGPIAGAPTVAATGPLAAEVVEYDVTPSPPASAVLVDDTTELPIFREIEASWFRSRGRAAPTEWSPSGSVLWPASAGPAAHEASPQAPPLRVPPRAAPTAAPTRGRSAGSDTDWWTVADDGWRAASSAANAPSAGTTRHGLPIRRPAAQLVPGGVEATDTNSTARRTPEDVRSLLSAYHRGVQRGRVGADGSAINVEPPTTQETTA